MVCPSHEELVCFEKVCGQPLSGHCVCQCVDGYHRDLKTNQCINDFCQKQFGIGPIPVCRSNDTVLCSEMTCSASDEFRCSCQCRNGFYRDPSSKKCVARCPIYI
ncbi:hypothetical protein GWI33_005415 [Rhynchophorus ferrugineus]|uniref:Uncharacterized protein n=1 Tax=Rhynchophorus ferrugineus TaxID=354439 RepID=A0A834IHH7_RHYFE|nr:hypothetical protein GWI33_005415 [Rhynchophorus ferrugineus]